MPKYEYACKSCGEHLEVLQTFADAPLTECPACGGPLRKVFSPPGIAFKGSGFYRTDNRKRRTEPKTDGVKTDGAKADAGTSASESKAESATTKSGDASGGTTKKESAPAVESKPKATEAKTA
jgi:putative FmdB family regulatory protein